MTVDFRRYVEARLPAIRETTLCWEWAGERDHHGYGVVRAGHWNYRAHRVAYELFVGPISPGMDICHHCDNPPCCNPAHLFVGTARDNMLDASRKGRLVRDPARLARGDRHGSRTHPEARPRGEAVVTSRFTATDIIAMRAMYAQGVSQHRIAAIFGTYQGSVGRIVRGEAWRHLIPSLAALDAEGKRIASWGEEADCADGVNLPGHGKAAGA